MVCFRVLSAFISVFHFASTSYAFGALDEEKRPSHCLGKKRAFENEKISVDSSGKKHQKPFKNDEEFEGFLADLESFFEQTSEGRLRISSESSPIGRCESSFSFLNMLAEAPSQFFPSISVSPIDPLLGGEFNFGIETECLNGKGHLTEKGIKLWIFNSNILNNEDKKTLSIVRPMEKAGCANDEIFFLSFQSGNEYVLKLYPPSDNEDFKDYHWSGMSQVFAKSGIPALFNGNSDKFPYVVSDIWSGSYFDSRGVRHDMSLMEKAKGHSLSECVDEFQNDEYTLPILKRVGSVIGAAHAATLIEASEDSFKSFFIHGDFSPINIYIDNKENPRLVTLIDTSGAAEALQNENNRNILLDVERCFLFRITATRLGEDRNDVEPFLRLQAFLFGYCSAFGENSEKVRKYILSSIYAGDYAPTLVASYGTPQDIIDSHLKEAHTTRLSREELDAEYLKLGCSPEDIGLWKKKYNIQPSVIYR